MNTMIDEKAFTPGFISELYAPKDDQNIQRGERCFYTTENANIIDTCMKYVHETVEPELFYSWNKYTSLTIRVIQNN